MLPEVKEKVTMSEWPSVAPEPEVSVSVWNPVEGCWSAIEVVSVEIGWQRRIEWQGQNCLVEVTQKENHFHIEILEGDLVFNGTGEAMEFALLCIGPRRLTSLCTPSREGILTM